MMRVFVAGALLSATVPAHGQSIRGTVLEDGTDARINGGVVNVVAPDGVTVTTQTDSAGAFLLHLSSTGRVQLQVRHPSYLPLDSVHLLVARGETVVVELRLSRTTIPLQPLLVRSERHPRLRGFHERMALPGSGQFITRADIDARPGARTTDLLREMHGVEIVPVGRGFTRPRVNLIAMRGCTPTLLIDGAVVRQLPESGIDDFLKPDMIDGVEVYTSLASIPPILDSGGTCGVVAFWTRSVEDVEAWSLRRLLAGAAALATLGVLVLLTR